MKSGKLLAELFLLFFKIGLVTFGGGVTMAPILMKEVVEKRGWIKEDELVECFALAQSLPGVVAVNVAVFIGHRLKGIAGAVTAVIASIIPAVAGILLFVALLEAFPLDHILSQGLKGVKSASVALIACTVIRMGKSVLTSKLDLVLFAAAFAASMFFDTNAILLVLLYALLGVINYLVYRKKNENA